MFRTLPRLVRYAALTTVATLVLPTPTLADDTEPLVSFKGFGSLGFSHTQGNGATFIRDLTQPHGTDNRGLHWEQDSRIGVQGNYKPTENLEAVLQVLSRYRNENNFAPEITWGFLKYTPTDQNTYSIGMRYDFASTAALKLQLDHVRNNDCSPVTLPAVGPGRACSPPLMWTSVPVGWNGRANIYSAVIDFLF